MERVTQSDPDRRKEKKIREKEQAEASGLSQNSSRGVLH